MPLKPLPERSLEAIRSTHTDLNELCEVREDSYFNVVHVFRAVLLEGRVEVSHGGVCAQDPGQVVEREGQHSTNLPLQREKIEEPGD